MDYISTDFGNDSSCCYIPLEHKHIDRQSHRKSYRCSEYTASIGVGKESVISKERKRKGKTIYIVPLCYK